MKSVKIKNGGGNNKLHNNILYYSYTNYEIYLSIKCYYRVIISAILDSERSESCIVGFILIYFFLYVHTLKRV